ncbi:MAG: thioredoxin [Desulfosudaceae bacterium]
MAENVIEITDSNFENDVLQADRPVLIDFWAPWCGPCKAIGPIVEELANDFAGKITFGKCNVDNNPTTPTKYGIQAIPTLILFKDGKIAEQITGMVPKAKMEEALKKVL